MPLVELAPVAGEAVRPFRGSRTYVATGDVDGDSLYPTTTVTFENRPSRANLIMTKGDVVFARMAGTDKAFIVGEDGGEFIYSTGFACLRPRPERANSRYLKHFLNSSHFHRQKDALATGATQRAITNDALCRIRIPAPTPDEQSRIADTLDKADAVRRKRRQAIALTEELLRSTFLGMVGPGAADYRKWDVRSIESLAAPTPNSLRTGPFGSDLLHSEFVDAGIAVLGIDNAVQNRFAWGERRFITFEKYDTLRRYTVFPGDVIVTIMGTTGRSAVVPDDIPTAITTKHLATITLDRGEAEPEFLSQALFRHPEVIRQISAANRGAIMNGLNLGLIKSLRLPVPPLPRQREFARVTARIRALARRLEGECEAETLFESLMARAFSGPYSEGAT